MTEKTEKKIIDAALKVFSEKGYVGATTKNISLIAGFSEMTLFRKFETKKNLFRAVLTQKQGEVLKDITSILVEVEDVDPPERLKILVYSMMDLIDRNFDYINIIVYERQRISDSMINKLISHLGEHMEKIFQKNEIDYYTLALNVLSFLYFNRFYKMGNTFFNHQKAVEEFIKYNTQCMSL